MGGLDGPLGSLQTSFNGCEVRTLFVVQKPSEVDQKISAFVFGEGTRIAQVLFGREEIALIASALLGPDRPPRVALQCSKMTGVIQFVLSNEVLLEGGEVSIPFSKGVEAVWNAWQSWPIESVEPERAPSLAPPRPAVPEKNWFLPIGLVALVAAFGAGCYLFIKFKN